MKNLKVVFAAVFFAVSGVLQASYTILTNEQPPFVIKNGDKAEGIAVDIVKEVFKRSKIDYKIEFNPLIRALTTTQKKKNTCAMPVSRSQDREYNYRWVSPLLVTQSAIFVKKGDTRPISVLKEVLKLNIGAIRGSDEAEYLTGFGGNIQEVTTDDANAKKLNGGRIDVWAADSIVGPYYAKKEGVEIESKIVFRSAMRTLACNLDIADKDFQSLENSLDSMYKDGSIKKIFSKYTKTLNIEDTAQFLN